MAKLPQTNTFATFICSRSKAKTVTSEIYSKLSVETLVTGIANVTMYDLIIMHFVVIFISLNDKTGKNCYEPYP